MGIKNPAPGTFALTHCPHLGSLSQEFFHTWFSLAEANRHPSNHMTFMVNQSRAGKKANVATNKANCRHDILHLNQDLGACSVEGQCGCGFLEWPLNQPITIGPQHWS